MKATRRGKLGSFAAAIGLVLAVVVLPSASATAVRPLAWTTPAAFDLGQNGSNLPYAVSCASVSLCVAVDGYGNVITSTNPTGGASTWSQANVESMIVGGLSVLQGVSCPSASFCVATEHLGSVFTSTDPTGGASAWTQTKIFSIFGPDGVSCASTTLCAAFFDTALTTSSNPTGPPTAWSDGFTDGHNFGGVSCPSTSLCVAVDDAGDVIVSTDPANSSPTWAVSSVDSGRSLDAIACPTVSLCVATDTVGDVVTSTDPTGGASAWTSSNVDATNPITAVSCPSSSVCLATDSNGNALYSADPSGGTAAWTTTSADANDDLTGISCPTTGTCIAVDYSGSEVVGSPAVELTVNVSGAGSGTVMASPAGISCPTVCSHGYLHGTSVSLAAAPDSGSTFTGWAGGGCSGIGGCQVTADADTTVTATFAVKAKPHKCVVPKVKGKALAAARQAIKSHDCSVGKVTHKTSRTIKKGHVIAQKPKPGSRLSHGAKVDLVVSKGK